MWLLGKLKTNVAALDLKGHLGVSYGTAWLVQNKFVECMWLAEVDREVTGVHHCDRYAKYAHRYLAE